MTRDVLVERLAAIEHERWADWQRWVHQCTDQVPYTDHEGMSREGQVIPNGPWLRWERQIATPYAELSEREKESDREQVMRYWPLIVAFVAEWLEGIGSKHADLLATQWRKDMG